jgi:hypothetical protein
MDRMANWCSHGGWFTLAIMIKIKLYKSNYMVFFFFLKQLELEFINKIQEPHNIGANPFNCRPNLFFMCHFTEVCGNDKHHMKPSWLSMIKTTQNSISLAPLGLNFFQITFIRSHSSRAFQQYQEHAQTSL